MSGGPQRRQDSSGHERGTYGVWEFYSRVSAEAKWVQDTIQSAGQTWMSETPSVPPVGESPGAARAVGSSDETPGSALVAEDSDDGSSLVTQAVVAVLGFLGGLAATSSAWWYRGRRKRLGQI